MTASLMFSGAFLWLWAIGVVALVVLACLWVREVLTEEPAADIEGQVEAGELRCIRRGMTS